MSLLCGWASISENGSTVGKAGDQTGKEVKIGNWYYFRQKHCLRWKSREYAKEYAKVIKALCKNEHIGYDQSQRTTLFNELKRLGWDYTKLTKNVECDCSELIACGVNCVLKREVIPSHVYTGNLSDYLVASGYFKKLIGNKYCLGSSYLSVGDVLNSPNHHVVSVLEDGSKLGQPNSKVAEPTLYRGCTGSEVKKLQSNLNQSGFNLTLDGIFGANTKTALANWQKKNNLKVDGVYGEKSYAVMKTQIK